MRGRPLSRAGRSRWCAALLLAVSCMVGGVAPGPAHASIATTVATDVVARTPFYCRWLSHQSWLSECPNRPRTGAEIEAFYAEPGPWAVSHRTVTDAAGAAYTVFHPTNLGAHRVRHPILTWGNGTGGTPMGNAATLTHLASWGYVVVSVNSGQTGWGREVLAGARHMVSENDNASSLFYRKLDTDRVGAFGHSQGATGAINATILSEGLITSTLPISLPDPVFFTNNQMPDFTRVDDPILFIAGNLDFLSTPPAQRDYYDRVSTASARATFRGAGHDITESGVIWGYVTAWMKYTLNGDRYARRAFVGRSPEIATNPSWEGWAQKGLG